METQDFQVERMRLVRSLNWGEVGKDLITIKIPTHCPVCSRRIKLDHSPGARDSFVNHCNHFHYGDTIDGTSHLWKHSWHLNTNLPICPQCGKEHR
jgi:hypothetical protein